MTVRKIAALAVIAATPLLLTGAPAQAFTARQATAGGQGTYATSAGMPPNLVAGESAAQPGTDGARGANQPRDLEHHNRYFGG